MVIHRRKFKKMVFSWSSSKFFYVFLGVLVLIIIGFLVEANFKINKRRSQFQTQITILESKVQELENLKKQYESSLGRAEADEFWEEKLREQGYKKPGEDVFVVVPQEEGNQQHVEKEKSFWQKLLEKIGF